MSNFNFSLKAITALVISLGVSLSANAEMGAIRVTSTNSHQFEAEIPVINESMPDSVSIGLADNLYSADSSEQANQLKFTRSGNHILVNGNLPPDGERINFSLEVSWSGRTLVREFQISNNSPLVTVSHHKKKANVLQLGDLKVVSALGQPLLMEVAVNDDAILSNIDRVKTKVKVFPDDSISSSDSSVAHMLSGLKYRVEKSYSGKAVLRLYSDQIISTPLLPLRIEANINGVHYKSRYVALFDPAGYKTARGHIISTGGHSELVGHQVISNKYDAGKLASSRISFSSTKGYHVLNGDSLSEVASKMHGGGSLAARMHELKNINPTAFINNDIDLLKSGVVLHYPKYWELASSSSSAKVKESSVNLSSDGNRHINSAVNLGSLHVPAPDIVKKGVVVAKTEELPSIVANSKGVKIATTPKVSGASANFKSSDATNLSIHSQREVPTTSSILAVESNDMTNKAMSEKKAHIAELQEQLARQDSQLKKADQLANKLQSKIEMLSQVPIGNQIDSTQSVAKTSHDDGFILSGGNYRLLAFYGVPGFSILFAFGFYFWRRSNTKYNSDSDLLDGMTGGASSLALTTLMSTSHASGSGDFEMLDPLVEAEKLLQSGNNIKALSFLRDGLTREPMRQDIRLSLLDVLAKSNEQHAFVEEALVAKTLFGVNSPLWQRILELAQVLDPAPNLFSAATIKNDGFDYMNQVVDTRSAPVGI